MLVAPPKADADVLTKLEHVGMLVQTFVRSIVAPPIGAGASILLPPSAGSLK